MTELFQTVRTYPFLGEVLSAGSAFLWAIAVLFFRVSGRSVPPLGLNLFKNILATVLFIITLLLLGQPLWPPFPWQSYALLALSGVIGIAISDTLFLHCLNLLGAGLTAIVDCLYSPFVILFSLLFIGERMSLRQASGVLFILAAVLLIAQKKENGAPARKNLVLGIAVGALAMVTMAGGIVMIKPLLTRSPVLWASFVRMGAGALAVAGFLFFHPRRREICRPLAVLSNWRAMVPASVLGAFASNFVWMAGMKLTRASVAAPLNQLTTIFIFILAAIFLREKVTRRKIAAVVLATLGAFLVSWP
jgi:drug/metabolite transporter (DMT)-like permease